MLVSGSEEQVASSVEKTLVLIACFCIIFVPLLAREFYPFSSFHVFVDKPTKYSRYKVASASGKRLSLLRFGLHRNYIGNGGYSLTQPGPHRGGQALPECIDLFGEVAHPKRVQEQVRSRLQVGEKVQVTQEVIGAVGQGIGVLARNTWWVERK